MDMMDLSGYLIQSLLSQWIYTTPECDKVWAVITFQPLFITPLAPHQGMEVRPFPLCASDTLSHLPFALMLACWHIIGFRQR